MRSLLVSALALSLTPALAETNAIPPADYLGSVDRTEVLFSGCIKYDSREDDFTFHDENREPFGVTVRDLNSQPLGSKAHKPRSSSFNTLDGSLIDPSSNFIIAGRLSNLPASPKRRESFYERVKKSGRQESVVVTVRLP